MRELLSHSVSQWCYGKDCQDFLSCCVKLGAADIWHTETAKIQVARANNIEIVIIGECVDVRDGHDADKISEGLCLFDGQAFEKEIEFLCILFPIKAQKNMHDFNA